MRSSLTARRSTPLLTALAFLVAAACGGGGEPATARVEEAAAKTTAAKTAKFAVNASASAQAQTISSVGQGVIDFGRHAVDVKFGRPANEAQALTEQQTIIIGTDTWLTTSKSVRDRLPTAKAYIHATAAERTANPLAQLTQPDDPILALTELTGIDGSTVKRVGKEDVRGVKGTHFQAQVDLTKVTSTDASAKQQVDGLRQLLGTNAMPVDVWLDGDGRVLRVRTTLQHVRVAPNVVTPTTANPSVKPGLLVDLTITNEFYDFGSPVSINAPPADQVTEQSQVPA